MAIEYFKDARGEYRGRFVRPPWSLTSGVLLYRIWNRKTNQFVGSRFLPSEKSEAEDSLKEWRETWEGEGGSAIDIVLMAVIDA